MKKRILTIVFVMLLTIAVPLNYYITVNEDNTPVLAYESMIAYADGLLPDGTDTTAKVMDTAWLMSDDEVYELEEKAAEISSEYECDTLVVTVDSLYGMNVTDYAKQVYQDYDLGYGTDKSGVMLLLSIGEREYSLIAYGYGNTAFTDYGKGLLEDGFLPYFGDNDFYSGFDRYLDDCEDFLYQAWIGEPVDTNSNYSADDGGFEVLGLVIGLVAGIVIAFIVCGIFKSQMKTAVEKETAEDYITGRGLRLTNQRDMFLHTSRSMVRIHDDDDGPGGTTIGSDGFSSSSGKF